MEVALACIQKLIAYGYVRGKVVQVGKVRRAMMDVVMETICSCKDQEDELVQLSGYLKKARRKRFVRHFTGSFGRDVTNSEAPPLFFPSYQASPT